VSNASNANKATAVATINDFHHIALRSTGQLEAPDLYSTRGWAAIPNPRVRHAVYNQLAYRRAVSDTQGQPCLVTLLPYRNDIPRFDPNLYFGVLCQVQVSHAQAELSTVRELPKHAG
jgi:hypothetical protein